MFTTLPGYAFLELGEFNIEWSDTTPDQEEEETHKKEMKMLFIAYPNISPSSSLGLFQNKSVHSIYTEIANPPCTPPPEL